MNKIYHFSISQKSLSDTNFPLFIDTSVFFFLSICGLRAVRADNNDILLKK